MVALLIVGIRLLAPLTILRYPFWGGLIAVAADASDVIICDALGGCALFGGERYHTLHKATYILHLNSPDRASGANLCRAGRRPSCSGGAPWGWPPSS